jgi:mediator of RNA polymerase II transcription subunit 7
MQSQLDRTRAETNAIRDVKEKVERILEGLGSLKMDDDLLNGIEGVKKDVPVHDKELWGAVMDEYP